MPRIQMTLATALRPTFRVEQVLGMFDLPRTSAACVALDVEVPDLDEPWTIGAIAGPSGSGKSAVARAAFGSAVISRYEWPHDEAVIESLGSGSIREITRILAAVGFSSPPAWLRPYAVLSGGEKFRCDLARALLSDAELIVCDEFTSVVDRTAAQFGSAALSKALRKSERRQRFVAVTCHHDVLPWLEPDWVLDMATGALTWGRLRRPRIELHVVRAPQSLWRRFARHHYLSGSLSRGATCYAAIYRGEPIAFCATIRMLGFARRKRVTRLVTLPDYQGLGVGPRLLEHVARLVCRLGERLSITTSHPALCRHLNASPAWQLTAVRRWRSGGSQIFRNARVRDSCGRAVASFEFVPDASREAAA